MGSWQGVLLEPAKTVLSQISQFLINVIGVLVILLAGWLIARVIKTVVVKVLQTIKIDSLSERIELNNLLAKGGIKNPLSELVGIIIYWLGLLVTFVVAMNAIGLSVAADLLNRIVLYIPHIIAAIFILLLGMFVATILKNIVLTASNNAGISQGKFLSRLTEAVIIVFTVIITVEQLGINARIIELAISILLFCLGLGIALAFGLGCKDIAGKFVAETIEKLRIKK